MRWEADTAVCIVSFNRIEHLTKTVLSIRDRHSDATILIGDNSTKENQLWAPLMCTRNVHLFFLPPDFGLSATRNYLVDEAERMGFTHALMCDDDWIFCNKTDVQELRHMADVADIASGHMVKYGRPMLASRWHQQNGKLIDNGSCAKGTAIQTMDFAGTYVLAKISTFKRCRFDDRLKVGEHVDWYLRARHLKLLTLLSPGNYVMDGGDEATDGTNDRAYRVNRNRGRRMFQQSLERWAPIFGRMEARRNGMVLGTQQSVPLPAISHVVHEGPPPEQYIWPSHKRLWNHVTPDVQALMGRCALCYHEGGIGTFLPASERPVVAPPLNVEAFLDLRNGHFGCVSGHLWMGEWLRRMVESEELGLPLAKQTAALFEGDAAEVKILE